MSGPVASRVTSDFRRCRMGFSAAADRFKGLGSDRWAAHTRGASRSAHGENIVLLPAGESDGPLPMAIVNFAKRQMRVGRFKCFGEPDIRRALSEKASRRTSQGRKEGSAPEC